MKLGVFARTFGGTDLTVLSASRAAASRRFSILWLFRHWLASRDDAGNRPKVQDAGLGDVGIAAISATYNMPDPDPERLVAGRRAFQPSTRRRRPWEAIWSPSAATQYRTSGNITGQQRQAKLDRNVPRVRDHLRTCRPTRRADRCRTGTREHLSNAERAARLIDDFGGPIRIILDPANMIEKLPPKIIADHRSGFDLLGDLWFWRMQRQVCQRPGLPTVGSLIGLIFWGPGSHQFNGALVAHGISYRPRRGQLRRSSGKAG